MPATGLLTRFGFTEDPFEKTDADQEPELSRYFVPPPYFEAVLGDPIRPGPTAVFAPRGGGKTAQRLMVENYAKQDQSLLCVTYDHFDQQPSHRLQSINLAYHLNQICRLVLIGVLMRLEADPSLADKLEKRQKQILKFHVGRFLGPLSSAQFEAAVASVKTVLDRAKDFWQTYGGPIAVALAVLMKKLGLDGLDIPRDMAEETRHDEALKFHLEQLLRIAGAIGFKSVYVLIDRVDELALVANDSSRTFKFIAPLITDLQTLETPGVGFKFFLWDRLEDDFYSQGGRADRVPVFVLKWRVDELIQMLGERLKAYSEGRVTSWNQMLCSGVTLDVHALVSRLAAGSPRDMIRISKRIISEQNRIDSNATCVTEAAVWGGLKRFSDERVRELYGSAFHEVSRIQSPTFTTAYLASNVLRVSHEAARQRIQVWVKSGIVQKTGEQPAVGRPHYVYGVTDPRVALAMKPESGVPEVLRETIFVCPHCDQLCISDRDPIDCPSENHSFPRGSAQSLLAYCQQEG